MGLVKSFERNIFLNLGRHLWNFFGVSGFIAFLTGIILLLNSTFTEIPNSRKEYFGTENIELNMIPLPYNEWLKATPLRNSYKWAEENKKPYPLSKNGKELINKDSWLEYQEYLKDQYKEYEIAKISELEIDKIELIITRSQLINKRNKQTEVYKTYINEIQDRNDIKYGQRLVSPFVIGYGLAVVASSSLSTALLAIERNTREKED